MATFSFTIPALTVDALKGQSGGTNSAFEATADRGFSRASTYSLLTAQFGDGYEQRVLNGINSKQDNFSVSFNNRNAEEINLIAAFFDSKAGKSFDFVITDSFSSGALSNSTIKVTCNEYNVSYNRETNHSLNCTLKRVYEP